MHILLIRRCQLLVGLGVTSLPLLDSGKQQAHGIGGGVRHFRLYVCVILTNDL